MKLLPIILGLLLLQGTASAQRAGSRFDTRSYERLRQDDLRRDIVNQKLRDDAVLRDVDRQRALDRVRADVLRQQQDRQIDKARLQDQALRQDLLRLELERASASQGEPSRREALQRQLTQDSPANATGREAEIVRARQTLERVQKMLARGLASPFELDRAQAEYDGARLQTYSFTCPHCKTKHTVARENRQPKCPQCSRVFQSSWQFCPVDGAKRPGSPDAWKFCPNCGKQVDLEKPAPAVGR